MIENIAIFLLFLTPLVFFHELGHFLFARLFGVRVENFSIGFGPKILKKKWGDTEYAFSLIPLGGYVKMFGSDPVRDENLSEEEKKYAFNYKSKWARFWIVFGGPLANFIFAYFLFVGLLMVGERVPEARLGSIPETNALYQNGLRSGDRVLEVNGKNVSGLQDFAIKVEGKQIKSMLIQRENEKKLINLNITSDYFKVVGPMVRPILVDKNGKGFWLDISADKANKKQSLESILDLERSNYYLYSLNSFGKKLDFSEEKAKEISIDPKLSKTEKISLLQEKFGLYTEGLTIKNVRVDFPAYVSGLKSGDILVSLNDEKLLSFFSLREILQKVELAPLKVGFYRNGELKTTTLTPTISEGKEKDKIIGVHGMLEFVPTSFVMTEPSGFFESFVLGVERTSHVLVSTVMGFKKLISGKASLDNIRGPLAISELASDTYNISFAYFISFMALMSINLGVINLFPIPVLDGGHIMFIFFEIINRGPLSRRKMELAQQVGLSLLLILLSVAIFNDVMA